MTAKIISYDDVRNDLPNVVGNVKSGATVLVQEANQPVAAIIPFEYYVALRQQLENLQSRQIVEATLEEPQSDSSPASSTDELAAEWERVASEILDDYDGAWKRLADQ